MNRRRALESTRDMGLVRAAIMIVLLGLSILASPAQAAPPASCTSDDSLSPTGSALWTGLADRLVVVTMQDGSERTGMVVGQTSETVALARAGDGELVSIDKQEVAGVRVSTRGSVGLEKDGRGRRVAGIMLMSLGSAAVFTGTLWLIVDWPSVWGYAPLIVAGGALVGGGFGLLKAGRRRQAAYERSWGLARARLMPSLAFGREGGQVGLTLRF